MTYLVISKGGNYYLPVSYNNSDIIKFIFHGKSQEEKTVMLSCTRHFLSAVLFLLATKAIYISYAFDSNKLPLWSWECVGEKCVPSKSTPTGNLQSLETCNMLCRPVQIWPYPTGAISLSTNAIPVRADLFQLIILSVPSRPVRRHLQEAFEILRVDLRHLESKVRSSKDYRRVTVQFIVSGSEDPRMRRDTDESYRLSIRPNGPNGTMVVEISAHSFCGARHALETLSQVVWHDPYIGSLLMYESANINDAPRFRYRGLLVDTARNYIPISDLLRTIDAMAASKLNTFHWHISDSQSFPLCLRGVPELAKYAAYSPVKVYTPDDVRVLVHRARLRGIRVLIEVDAPAHVGQAWIWGPAAGMGDLVQCLDVEPWSEYCSEPPCGQLNPRNIHVYDVLERIYTEIISLTGVEDMFHIGGDDVSERCWAQYYNGTTHLDLWFEFTRSVIQRLEAVNGKLPKLVIMWYSHLSERMKTDLTEYVHVIALQARNVGWATNYLSGVRTILSHEDMWDLNSGMGAWFEERGGAPYISWQRVYEHRPWVRSPSVLMEGGEATVWSMSLSVDGLDASVWPRAAALAERLWADRPEGATRSTHARLDVHRARLVARGVKAAPLWSMWCSHNTFTCG